MERKLFKATLVIFILTAIAAFFIFDLKQYTTLDYIKTQQQALENYYSQNTFLVLSIFGVLYVAITALSLPAATALTLLAGALFGFITGLIMVSFASSIGATIAFLMSRFLFRDHVQQKYGKYLTKINDGFNREGAFYLFALRLVPAVPFFIINLMMALVPIKTRVFYIVSQIGMLPGTAVYVFAGTELGKISSFSDIISPPLLIAFTFLGIFPIIAKKTLSLLRKKYYA